MNVSTWVRARWPYLVLAPASFIALHGLMMASSNAPDASSSFHNVGLFFFPGVVASECGDPVLRKSYFVLHLTMALFISIICKSIKDDAIFCVARRVCHFAWAYLAVGMAAPILLAIQGDRGIFDDGDDSNFDTYCLILINLGWFLLCQFPMTSCEEMYDIETSMTKFDVACIVWAGLAMLPLLCYRWRALLPSIWSQFGFSSLDGVDGYTALAWLNGLLMVVFFGREVIFGMTGENGDDGEGSIIATLSQTQMEMYEWHRFAAIADYVFMMVTLAVLVFRTDPAHRYSTALLVLLLPPVGFSLFLRDLHARRTKTR